MSDKNANDDVLQFIQQQRTAILASVNSQAEPLASYAPFVFAGGEFFVLLSQLAAHTKNLTSQRKCHLLLIRDEQDSPNLFARHRLSFHCRVRVVERDLPEFTAMIALFRQRCGPVVDMLASLPDFVLFALTPGEGNFVQGFGRARPST